MLMHGSSTVCPTKKYAQIVFKIVNCIGLLTIIEVFTWQKEYVWNRLPIIHFQMYLEYYCISYTLN